MEFCLICCSVEAKGKRRVLHSASTLHVVSTLRSLMQDVYVKEDVDRVLPLQVPSNSSLYICMKCFRTLERYMKARNELEEGIRKVGEKLSMRSIKPGSSDACTSSKPSESQTGALQLTPKRKRRSDDSTPLAKRQRIDTPVRDMISRIHAPNTPLVSVIEKRHQKVRLQRLTHSLKTLGRCVGRRDRSAIAHQVVKDARILKKLIPHMGKVLAKELKATCSVDAKCLLGNRELTTLESFTWNQLLSQLKKTAPNTVSLLTSTITSSKKSTCSPSQEERCGRSRSRAANTKAIVALCCSLLLRARSQRMNLVQKLISVILYGGHASKQVYTRLQKLLLCVSHKSTLRLIDKLGDAYDEPVKTWKEDIESRKLQTNQQPLKPTDNDSTSGSLSDPNPGPSANSNPDPSSNLNCGSEQPAAGPVSLKVVTFSDVSSDTPSDSRTVASSVSKISEGTHDTQPSVNSGEMTTTSSTSDDSFFKLDDVLGTELSFIPSTETPKTYKIVMDNIDKNIKPNQMREDHQTRSLHYMHKYAVRDRIDLSSYDDKPCLPDIATIRLGSILPSDADHTAIRANMATLIARILVRNLPFLAKFKSSLELHIRHEFTKEMSQMSEVVPLGVTLKSETSYEDMVSIMEELHSYVPTVTTTAVVDVDDNEETEVVYDDFHYILVGGDQLTAARARGSQRIRRCGQRPRERLEGVLPVCEDWHAKVVLLGVIWRRFYKVTSSRDSGTLFQLRNLVNRRNIKTKPDKDVAASEDFLITVVEAHIIAAAMDLFGMKSIDDTPSSTYFPEGCSRLNSMEKKKVLTLACSALVDKFVNITFSSDSTVFDKQTPDLVNGYASNLMSLGLLLMEFNDGIREGDGNRIIRCWRYFLPIFKAEGRTNYSVEAFVLLSQYEFLFTPRMAAQLKWCRTINTHGRIGKNISCDLHMEHLNRDVKTSIAGLGSNITDQSILRAGKSLKKHLLIQQKFDMENDVPAQSSKHSKRSSNKDRNKIIEQLNSAEVFKFVPGRHHRTFSNFQTNMFDNLSKKDLDSWMKEQLQKLLMFT